MPADPDGSSTAPAISPSPVKFEKPVIADSSPLVMLGKWVRDAFSKPDVTLKEALQEVLDEHEAEGGVAVSSDQRNLLRNMIAFGELKVGDVMIPRTDILAVPESVTTEEMKAHIAEHRHTRVPIYSDSLDHITGFIHIKDFFLTLVSNTTFNLSELRRDILFVPHSMKIIDLLMKMRLSSCHMAIVVDEYGGTDGLVTMEDLFEEIVGEIQDEHDEDEVSPVMKWMSERALEADARVKIEDLIQELKIDLTAGQEDDDYDTLGGLIFSHLGRVPAKGEVIDYAHGLKLEILSADPRSIKKVRITRVEPVVMHSGK